MDVLGAVLGAVPQLGALGGMAVLVVVLMRREVQTTERHTAEMERQAKVYDEERADLLAENRRLRDTLTYAEMELSEMRRRAP